MSRTKDNANRPHQKGAPQDTQEMPSSGNSPQQTGVTRGTDESVGGSQDVERSGSAGTGTRRAPDTLLEGDPGEAAAGANPQQRG